MWQSCSWCFTGVSAVRQGGSLFSYKAHACIYLHYILATLRAHTYARVIHSPFFLPAFKSEARFSFGLPSRQQYQNESIKILLFFLSLPYQTIPSKLTTPSPLQRPPEKSPLRHESIKIKFTCYGNEAGESEGRWHLRRWAIRAVIGRRSRGEVAYLAGVIGPALV